MRASKMLYGHYIYLMPHCTTSVNYNCHTNTRSLYLYVWENINILSKRHIYNANLTAFAYSAVGWRVF